MKKIAFFALACVCFSTVVVTLSYAQTVGLRVAVPFEFNVEEKVLPAGQYLILAPQGGTLRILGPNGSAALAMTNPAKAHRFGPGTVAFNCYGNRCFLSQLWTSRTEGGQELFKCSLEKELAGQRDLLAVITLRGIPSNQ